MRYFFTEESSQDNGPVVELQRRATWLGLALILQVLSELSYNVPQELRDFSFYLYLLLHFLALALILGSFTVMWMAFRPDTVKQQTQPLHKHPRPWQRVVLVLTLLLSVVGGVLWGLTLVESFSPPQYSNDGTSLDANAAQLLLQGRNPYTDSSILDIARRFQIQPDWTTPLRQGQFANRLEYPTRIDFRTALDTDLKAGQAPEFESRISYPALAFLTLVPFVLFKNDNVLPFYLLCYLLLVAFAWRVARPELRPWVLLLAMANVPMWSSVLSGNLDIFDTLLIVLALLQRKLRWRSALFLGLALASKQISWFFAPFYVVMIWRSHDKSGSYGLTEAVRRLAIAWFIGLAFNLPFILWNPQAWLAGVLAPIADPMFPLGIGLIDLSVIHALPFFPQWVYSALEGSAVLLSLVWYWRLSRTHPEAMMLLAVIPLLFAWRSLPSYFFGIAYPIFVLMVARVLPSRHQAVHRSVSLLSESGHQTSWDIPVWVGICTAYGRRVYRSSRELVGVLISNVVRFVSPIIHAPAVPVSLALCIASCLVCYTAMK